MPRFKTLSDAIKAQVDAQVSPIKFPDGSILNQQIGRIPFPQNLAYNTKDKSFIWGFSTWGLESISSETRPDNTL